MRRWRTAISTVHRTAPSAAPASAAASEEGSAAASAAAAAPAASRDAKVTPGTKHTLVSLWTVVTFAFAPALAPAFASAAASSASVAPFLALTLTCSGRHEPQQRQWGRRLKLR